MTKKQDEMISILREIKSELDEQSLRLDEIENAMLEVTGSISADIRTTMKALKISRKKKRRRDMEKSAPDIPADEWPIVEPGGDIQESDQ